MLAALYGRWQAGIVTFILSFAWAWWWVLPMPKSFDFALPADQSRVVVNAICGLIIILFAEIFRRAVEMSTAERDMEIERRERLMIELEHRTKNNFALVASLLHSQRQKETSPELQLAFDTAIGRVQSFAQAYALLSEDNGRDDSVDMKRFLERLLASVAPAMFGGNVEVRTDIEPLHLEREKAVAIGLVCNEAMTNAAKYAFEGKGEGRIHVRLTGTEEKWRFSIADDGVGLPKSRKEGIGSRLLDAFAAQADGLLDMPATKIGTEIVLTSK